MQYNGGLLEEAILLPTCQFFVILIGIYKNTWGVKK